MKIRRADITDCLAIWQISKNAGYPVPELEYSEEGIKRLFARGDAIFIAELHGEPIGYVALKVGKKTRVEMDSLEVRRGHQRQGVGTLLIEKAEEAAKELGKAEILLHCHPRNKAAIKFYNARGYEQRGLAPDHYSTGEPSLVFSKKIK